MNKIGIDVVTRCRNELIRRLDKLKTTESVEDGGMYWADKSYSQVHVVTSWTEEELDDWLYTTKFSKDFEYVGTFEMETENG